MTVRVLLFAVLKERLGREEIEIDLPPRATVEDLTRSLFRDFAPLHGYENRLVVAVNHEPALPETRLCEGDEIALLPPMSGGGGARPARDKRFWLTDRPIDPGEVSRRAARPEAGAVALFVGTVRRLSRGREITHLEYDAYGGMAEKTMREIGEAVEKRWPGSRCAIVHRTGRCEVGEISVVIAVAMPHRREAFDACHWAIDRLKTTVPIWKKEVATDGEYWIEEKA